MKTRRSLVLLGGVLAGLALAWGLQYRRGAALRSELAVERSRSTDLARLQVENRLLKAEQVSTGELERLRTDSAAVARLKAELDQMEKAAQLRDAAGAVPLAGNRDPTKGPVAVKEVMNVGRLSPSTAFQTMLWALVHGDDELLASSITMSAANRQIGEALIASLPEADRARHPTPEKLWGLFFSPELVKMWQSIHLVSETMEGAQKASLDIVTTGPQPEELTLQMELAPSGWQFVLPEPHMSALRRLLKQATAPKIRQKVVP